MLFTKVLNMRGIKNLALKNQAVLLRKKGLSYNEIGLKLGVGKSTLNGWFSGLVLSEKIKKILLDKKNNNLIVIRNKALVSLKNKRDGQYNVLKSEMDRTLSQINFDKNTKEAMLAMLYLGEGFKAKSVIGLGNSNSGIMSLFVGLLRSIYKIEEEKFRIFLHLRYDQNDVLEKKYWSKLLSIPLNKFGKTQFDQRTKGSKTWSEYHGVCAAYYYDARIEKRLTILQKSIINTLVK